MRSAECGLYLGYSRIARLGSARLAASPYAGLRIAERSLDRMNRINWFFKTGHDGEREIIVGSAGRDCRVGGNPCADSPDCRARSHGVDAKQEGADGLGADSVNNLRS